MKKAVALFLTFVMCLSFVACDVDRNTPAKNPSQETILNEPTSGSGHVTTEPAPDPGPVTVVCPVCSGLKTCTKCHGEQDCLECGGKGVSRCWDCLGDGECLNCSGDRGSYEYDYYAGETKWVKCRYCNGSGNCVTCKGKRETTCRRCNGNRGYCSYCSNSNTCYYCKGIGTITQSNVSNPPHTNPQEPEHNKTDSPKTSDYLIATIDGTEYQFDLVSANVHTDYSKKFTYIRAHYCAVNPRGELLYDLYITFDANLACGTYDIIGDSYALDLGMTLIPANCTSETGYHSSRAGGTSAVGSFTITERSADWNTYSGCGNATLKQTNLHGKVKVNISYFTFTLS